MLEPNTIARYERELRAMLRTAGDEDPEGFAAVHQLLTQAVNALPVAAELTRRQHGYSWADLARALGVTRQAAQQRLGTDKMTGCAAGEEVTELRGRLLRRVRYFAKTEAPA